MVKKKLSTYGSRRDFSVTPEPSDTQKTKNTTLPIFVVQKHAASHLHYDFRLEDHGVLISWAVPKGIPLRSGKKHLAIQTEDHPLAYAHFAGTIPAGNYGAGTVEIWDNGTFKNLTKDKSGHIIPISECLKMGRLKVEVTGQKLDGIYVFIKTELSNHSNWLLFKLGKKMTEKILGSDKIRVGRQSIMLTHLDKIMFPADRQGNGIGITKGEVVNYYHAIATHMLPFTKNRFVTMFRAPDGITGKTFYQKVMPNNYPDWISSAMIPLKKDGQNRMVLINRAATLVYLANQDCITPHISLSRIDKLDYPDRMIFDLDPSINNSFTQICQTALKLKTVLEKYGLKPFVMTTGSRGLHVVIPLIRNSDFDTARAYAHAIANQFVAQDPEKLTTEIRKEKRGNRIYVDISRNAYGQTSVTPYAIRAKPNAPVATPLFWPELTDKKLTAQSYTIKNVLKKLERDGDPWADFARSKRALKKIR